MYYVIRLKNVSDPAEDWISAASFTWGASGISEDMPFTQKEGEVEVEILRDRPRQLQVYFESAPPAGFFQEIQARFPEIEVAADEQPDQDWLAEWKKGFQPFSLVEDYWIVPSWCEVPDAAKHPLKIDPGMAFGTGTHETTQVVAEMILPRLKKEPPAAVLDVGTGTGILGMLADRAGVPRVVGIDIEAEARRVARENIELNHSNLIILDDQISDIQETFPMVIANIIDGVLIRLRDELFRCLRKDGLLVLSGIIDEREEHFLANFKLPDGYCWSERRQKGEWIGFIAGPVKGG